MRTSIKNLTVISLALVAIAAWGLVIRQEIERRQHPQPVLSDVLSPSKGPAEGTIPVGGSITLPAPGSGPTEETPAIEIFGTITDAQTGRPVVADVHAANVFLDDVTLFRLIFPATCPEDPPERVEGPCRRGDEEITLTVTAPGYQEWSVGIKPHISHSKVLTVPIKLVPSAKRIKGLKRKPAGNQT